MSDPHEGSRSNGRHDAENGNGSQPASHYEGESLSYKATRWMKRLLGQRIDQSLKDVLTEALEEHEGLLDSFTSEEKTLIRNMLSFGELTVADIMIPRMDILSVEKSISLEELKHKFLEMQHTRLPVYEGSLDKVVGFIHLKDLLPFIDDNTRSFDLTTLAREILFVPPSMRIVDLLLKMRVSSCHMAIVVDEYGGTDGLVTMEDLVEEIVGEIQDEHDDIEAHALHWVSERVIDADARVTVEEVEKLIKVDIGDDVDTLAGLIVSHLGRVPAKGEVVDMPNEVRMEILAADPRRVRKVRIFQPLPKEQAPTPPTPMV